MRETSQNSPLKDLQNPTVTEVTPENIGKLIPDLILLDLLNFGDQGWNESIFQEFLFTPGAVFVSISDSNESIIGYALTMPSETAYSSHPDYSSRDANAEVAYLTNIALQPKFQGFGLVGLIMSSLEKELKTQGYKYLDEDASVENGYADKVTKHYGTRICKKEGPNPSDYGQQMYFRIKL